MTKTQKKKVVDDHLHLVGFDGFEDKFPNHLSGGMQQRVALATGCEVEIRDESKPYSDFRTADRALRFYETNALSLGRELHREGDGPEAEMCRASTDMANVSWAVPAIHP